MRLFVKQALSVTMSCCLIFSAMVGAPCAVATSTSKQQPSAYLIPNVASFPTQFSQGKSPKRIQIEYIKEVYQPTEYLQTEYLETEHLKTEHIQVEHINIVYEEIEFISLDDESFPLVEERLKSVYGDDFDTKKFLIDIGTAVGVILVYVTLSAVGGPIGTFFGAVITQGITASGAVIMAGIEGGIAAYKAYEEGGDFAYIAGHALNGVAEGIKWWAAFAPVDAAVQGICAIKAVKAMKGIKGIKGLQKMSDREIVKLLDEFPNIWRNGSKIDTKSEAQLHKAYMKWAENNKKATENISEDLFKQVLEQQQKILKIIEETNLSRVSVALDRVKLEEEQKQFLKKIGSDWEYIHKIQRGDVTSIAKNDTAIQKNFAELIKFFGPQLNKSYIESFLQNAFNGINKEVFPFIQQHIADKELLCKIFDTFGEKIGHQIANKLMDEGVLEALKLRYGPKNIIRLEKELQVYYRLGFVDIKTRAMVFKGIRAGEYKTFEDIVPSTKGVQQPKNIVELAYAIKQAGWRESYALISDIAKKRLVSTFGNHAKDMVEDIVTNTLSKEQIIEKYGKKVYQKLAQVENFSVITSILPKNQRLLDSIVTDKLVQAGIGEKAISKILKGQSVATWGTTQQQQEKITGILLDYYKTKDFPAPKYTQLEKEIGEIRAKQSKRMLDNCEKEVRIINKKQAGQIMVPNDRHKAEYIRALYGDIRMNSKGFPIFDRWAIERVEISNLTGINSVDFALANEKVYGIKSKGSPIAGAYTWHHLENTSQMILIPRELHESYRHTGGASIITHCGLGIR